MVLIRTFEEAFLRDYHADKKPAWDIGAGLIPGEMHLPAGQEPVAVGVCVHLNDGRHRRRHASPAPLRDRQGRALDRMTAEIFGKVTGLGRGKGGHMHLFDPVTHFSCCGIIARGCRRRCGAALRVEAPQTARSPWPSSARARPTRAPSTSRSTSPRSGTCRWCSSVEDNGYAISVEKRQATAAVPRTRAAPRPTTCPASRCRPTMRGGLQRRRRGHRAGAQGRRPHASSKSRPLA